MSESNKIFIKILIYPKLSLELKNNLDENNCIKYFNIPKFMLKENNDKKRNIFDKLGSFDFFEL